MDGSSIEEKETGQSTKRLKISEVNEDFISNLPDSILLRILSFLPLRDAIKTALLRRFGKLWLSMPVLDLDHCSHVIGIFDDGEDCDYDKFMDIIHQVWNHHENTILEKLRLKFYFRLTFSKNEDYIKAEVIRHCISAFSDFPGLEDHIKREIIEKGVEEDIEKEKAAAHQIEKLLDYALSRKVSVLDLDFKGCASEVRLHKIYELPNIFRSNYLRNLELTGCDIRSCANICLQALRVLSLHEVYLTDKVMKQLLLGCSLLEDLSIDDCYGLGNLNCESPNLKKLMLSLIENRRLLLSCPHAVSLRLLGLKERVTLLNVSSLVDASISLCNLFERKQKRYADVWRLLLMLQQCKTISLCDSGIAVMSTWRLRDLVCPSFNWKKLKFHLDLAKCHLPGLSFLFKSCPSLETLTISVFPWFDRRFKAYERKWSRRFDFDGENYLESEEVTLPCLKSILIYGNVIVPYMIQVVQFLLKNAPNLQKMEISTKKMSEYSDTESDDEEDPHTSERQDNRYTSEQMLEFSHKLTTSPRASSQAMIYFD